MSTTLQDLVNSAVFLSTEMQSHFGRLIADASWDVDFTADPQLTFSSEDGTLRTRPHLLGSESHGTWLWGWENINDFPEPVVAVSHRVRRFGAGEGVPELTTPELELDDELALRLTLAAKAATGMWAHYPAAAGAGTTVWLLVEAPELALPAPRVKATVRALMQGLTLTTVDDHRAALEAYVARRGVPTVALPDDGIRLLFSDGSADLSFDEQRRISNCEVQSPLEGEAAEQFASSDAAGAGTGAAGATATGAAGAGASAAGAGAVGAPTTRATEGAGAEATAPGSEKPAEATTPATEKPAEVPAPASAAAETKAAETRRPVGDEQEQRTEVTDERERAGTLAVGDAAEEAAARDETAAREQVEADATHEETTAGSGPADRRPGAARDEAAARDETEAAREDQTEQPKKKKGLFSKLFGR